MYKLKTLTKEAIPEALRKAERYRLLGEPHEAESICLDIIEVQPRNQDALVMLLLSHTDKFKISLTPAFNQAKSVLPRLDGEHCQHYYRGIIYERRAKAHLDHGGPSSGEIAHGWYIKAMADYEKAMEDCAPGNDSAALRWNTCARILNEYPNLSPAKEARDIEVMDGWE